MRSRNKGDIFFYTLESLDNLHIVRGKHVINNFPKHLHRRFCIGTIEKGSAVFFLKQREFPLSKGDVFLINPGETHTIKPIDLDGFDHLVFCLGKDLSFYYCNEMDTDACRNIRFSSPVVSEKIIGRKLVSLLDIIIDTGTMLETECAFMTLLSDLYPHCFPYKLNEYNMECIQYVCEYISENYMKKLTLLELSSVAHLSKFHFSRLFKRQVGLTPYEYQIQVIIKHSQELILNQNSIVNVALELGFVDQSHFTNMFKKHVGVTPSKYIKMNKKL